MPISIDEAQAMSDRLAEYVKGNVHNGSAIEINTLKKRCEEFIAQYPPDVVEEVKREAAIKIDKMYGIKR